MKLLLYHRTDRLGSYFIGLLVQLIYAHYHKYYIIVDKINQYRYQDSIFIQYMIELIDRHNNSIQILDNDNTIFDGSILGDDICYGLGHTVYSTKYDILSYYNKYLLNIYHYNNVFNNCKYQISFDVDNTIIIHMRLDDVSNFPDYDGSYCFNYYKELVNKGKITNFRRVYNNNFQSPLSIDKIYYQLNILKMLYPNDNVIIITSNNSILPNITFEYDQLIQSDDYNYDLYLLSKCKKIILSRSNFALMSLFLGSHTDVNMPLWGYFACCGFGTDFDNCNYNYFY